MYWQILFLITVICAAILTPIVTSYLAPKKYSVRYVFVFILSFFSGILVVGTLVGIAGGILFGLYKLLFFLFF